MSDGGFCWRIAPWPHAAREARGESALARLLVSVQEESKLEERFGTRECFAFISDNFGAVRRHHSRYRVIASKIKTTSTSIAKKNAAEVPGNYCFSGIGIQNEIAPEMCLIVVCFAKSSSIRQQCCSIVCQEFRGGRFLE